MKGILTGGCPCYLAAVTVLILAVVLLLLILLTLLILLVLIAILILLVLIAILILLILILVIHGKFLRKVICGRTAVIDCPKIQLLSFGLKIRLTASPAAMAAVIPPAVAFNPPVNMPIKPS